jgi:hypothetical protein
MKQPIGADVGAMAVPAPPLAQYGSHRVADPSDPPRQMIGLGWGAMVSLGVVGLLDLARIFSALGLHSAASAESNLTSEYHGYTVWVGLSGFALLVSAGVFIAWFYRAYKNLRRLGVQNMRYRLGWAIGAWFVPILSLFRPKQIANDTWRGSERGVEVSMQWRQVGVPSLVHWWWGLFLAQGLLLEVGQRMATAGYGKLTRFGEGSVSAGLSQIKTGTVVDILGSITAIAAVVLAIMVVSRISQRLDLIREDALAAEPVATPPPTAVTPPMTSFPPPPPPSATPVAASVPPPTTAPVDTSGPPPSTASTAPASVAGEQRIQCPECAEWIQPQAKVCRFCGHWIEPAGQ